MSEIKPELLLQAYAVGVFPMAEGRDDTRLFFVEIHCNRDFARVLALCASPADDRPDTWINPEIERLYQVLHERGQCHSIECWRDGELVGGLYGLALGGAFFGESMFSRARDASKVALAHLVARLRAGGFTLLDTQFITDHLAQFGAVEIPRRDYRRRLEAAIATPANFFPENYPEDGAWSAVGAFLQSTNQTS